MCQAAISVLYSMIALVFNRFMYHGHLHVHNLNVIWYLLVHMGISHIAGKKNNNLTKKQKITKDAWKSLETQTLPVILKACCMKILWHIGISF